MDRVRVEPATSRYESDTLPLDHSTHICFMLFMVEMTETDAEHYNSNSLLPETISGYPVRGHHTARGGLTISALGTHHTSKTVSGYSMRGHHTALGCLKISTLGTPHTSEAVSGYPLCGHHTQPVAVSTQPLAVSRYPLWGHPTYPRQSRDIRCDDTTHSLRLSSDIHCADTTHSTKLSRATC